MSGQNPNVFYEVGYARALGKRTILLTDDVKSIPFDLVQYPHIIYDRQRIAALNEALEPRLREGLEVEGVRTGDVEQLAVFHAGEPVLEGQFLHVETMRASNYRAFNLDLAVCNVSNRMYQGGTFVAYLVPPTVWSEGTAIRLPDGRNLHHRTRLTPIYPGAWASLKYQFRVLDEHPGDTVPMTMRLSTPSGSTDLGFQVALSSSE